MLLGRSARLAAVVAGRWFVGNTGVAGLGGVAAVAGYGAGGCERAVMSVGRVTMARLTEAVLAFREVHHEKADY